MERYTPNWNSEDCGVCREVSDHIVEGYILEDDFLEVWCPACYFTAYPWEIVLSAYKTMVRGRETETIITELVRSKTLPMTEDIYSPLLTGDDNGE